MPPGKSLAATLVALALWAFTAAAGLVEIYLLRQTVLRLYGYFGNDYATGVFLGNIAAVLLSLLWLALAVGAGEYHRQRVGQPGSWRLFGWTIAVELAILWLYFTMV